MSKSALGHLKPDSSMMNLERREADRPGAMSNADLGHPELDFAIMDMMTCPKQLLGFRNSIPD
jgi:hypothetical protein